MNNFDDVTEIAGTLISKEQLFRMYNRYSWAADLSEGCDVLEVACGVGQGVALMASKAKSVQAGDFSKAMVRRARSHYRERFKFSQFDAQEMPFSDDTFDIIVIHEALYYIPNAERFVAEACRVLRSGGRVLITNSNKDLFDFNPSPYSTTYHGITELRELFENNSFTTQFWGSQPVKEMGLTEKITRPLKLFAVQLGLMPKTMRGKQLLKRVIFSKPVVMPAEILPGTSIREKLVPLDSTIPCKSHKIIYCCATLSI